MNGYLVDTNVPSELTNSRPDERVVRWLDEANAKEHGLVVVTRNDRDFEGLGLDVLNLWET